MSIVFAARGDSFNAVYAPGGGSGTKFGTVPTVSAGLSGTNYDLTSAAATKYVSFPGQYNTPNGRLMSILIRLAPGYSGSPAADRAIFALTSGVGNTGAFLELRHTSTGTLVLQGRNEALATAVNSLSFGSWSPTSGTYYDLVLHFPGTTTANATILDIDAVQLGTVTAGAAYSSSWTNTWWKSIVLGCNTNTSTSSYKFDELVIWDNDITSSSVTLVSGSGSLNGASRTSLVSVNTFGGPFTGSRGRTV